MRITLVTLTIGALVACGGDAPPPTPEPTTVTAPAPDASTEKAAKIAAISLEIRANPEGYEAILTKHGMTTVEFDAALYDIAADPALSARYAAEFPAR